MAKEAKAKAVQAEKAKIDKILRKDYEAEMRKAQRERERRISLEEEAQEKEAKRRALAEAYDRMRAKEEERVQRIQLEARLKAESIARRKREMSADDDERKLLDELREMDRQEAREKARRKQEHRRRKIQKKREEANQRAQRIEEERKRMIMEKKRVQISAMKRRADVNKIFDKMKSTGNFNLTKDVQEKLGFDAANIDRSKLLRPKSAGAIPSPSRAKRSSRAKGAADGPDSGLMSTDPPQADQPPLGVGGEVQVQAQADDAEVRKEPRVLKTRRARPMSARRNSSRANLPAFHKPA